MNQPQIGTYNVGTQLTVGSHQVEIVKYLTSGGFAQVYSALISPPDPHSHSNIACLKRVIVPDKPSLNTLRAEVDAMRLLRNNRYVVSYIDSHAAKAMLHNGSYEVFVLMEYCERGGLIDFMNTRLQNRLHEFEILQIMSQVTQGVAAMHALQPPLIHRDIKIENVLISANNEYKLCDFGSVCGVIRPPRNPQELSYVQQDIFKNTTAQYRSPEMVDIFRGLPIDEKSDIWALGIFLYKLCYYTTPFEKGGEPAILSGHFEFPPYPDYSEQLRDLIRDILVQNPCQRPNVYQLLKRISIMQNVPCPISDIQVPQAPDSHLNLTELHQLSATQNIRSLNSHSTIERPIPNPAFQSSMPDAATQTLFSRKKSQTSDNTTLNYSAENPQTSLDKSESVSHVLDPLLFESGMSNTSKSLNRAKVSSTTKLKQVIDSEAHNFRHNYTMNLPLRNIIPQDDDSSSSSDELYPEDVDKLEKTQSLGSYISRDNKKGESVKESLTSSSLPGSSLTATSTKLDLKLETLPNSTFVNTVDNCKNSFRNFSKSNPLTYDDVSVSRQDLKNSIRQRMLDKLNSSEESFNARKMPKAKASEKESTGKPIALKPGISTSKDKKAKPIPPPKPLHLRPKPPPKPLFLAGQKLSEK
ncbi:Ark1p [Saccharomyces cerevisiae x Saccharomyces kudriavzevii VIN7]|uniref:non-specific serine/threonine protein kinase n=1 Tax=Saccharomyces cerevisiae x Saccharomyces kudriavzevii (strain VIN7) TaxID=1095631 RepID=H0H0D4_SACCK|nr:Ark1p [Saccharomyces cerevisiae x Saccharomyces kudriavzevii VIN7]